MKIHYQISPQYNGVAAIKNLIGLLRVKVSAKALEEVRQSPQYPSLDSLSTVLSDWNIENMGVRLSLDQLVEIPYPAIGHLRKNNGHFVVLQKLVNGTMHHIDPEEGEVTEQLENFGEKWSGVVLLVQANEKSGEPDYKKKRKIELFNQASSTLSLLLTVGLILFPAFLLQPSLIPLYTIKLIGGILAIILLLKQFGNTSPTVSSFCRLGGKSDCDDVIHSPASKLFGIVHLSELGVLYFLGSIIFIGLSGFSGHSTAGWLLVLNSLVLPFTLFSIYYQWRVLKKWCPLCLAVMAIFWFEFIALMVGDKPYSFQINNSFFAFFSFSLPLAFWLTVRERFMDAFKIQGIEQNLNKFKKSERVFQALLEQESQVDIENFTTELQSGSEDAKVELTIVSNPFCGPCSYAHTVIDDLLERFGDKINVRFRFTVNPSDTTAKATRMVRHLIAHALNGPEQNTRVLLASWFSANGRANIDRWMAQNPLSEVSNVEKTDSILKNHADWCKRINIKATPTIFINGKKVPEEFSVSDLRFQIRKILEKEPVSVPEPVS
ncbi:MAG: thioredoxin domain-containing protein [Cyclobacteriaceae bacterium]|nr:thioredoxin domain-containing protein [Cyclobacteriaceae bacterium]